MPRQNPPRSQPPSPQHPPRPSSRSPKPPQEVDRKAGLLFLSLLAGAATPGGSPSPHHSPQKTHFPTAGGGDPQKTTYHGVWGGKLKNTVHADTALKGIWGEIAWMVTAFWGDHPRPRATGCTATRIPVDGVFRVAVLDKNHYICYR